MAHKFQSFDYNFEYNELAFTIGDDTCIYSLYPSGKIFQMKYKL